MRLREPGSRREAPPAPGPCYWNLRRRGFEKALEVAGLSGRGITIHDLRSAAASLYAAKGLTHVEVAEVLDTPTQT